MMLRLIPKIFYADIRDGLDLFVDGLEFKIVHQDKTLTVIECEGAKAYLVQDAEYAEKDRPELAIETDSIEDDYDDIALRRPDLLHPNLKSIQTRPWGAREFALLDKTGVCVIFRQW